MSDDRRAYSEPEFAMILSRASELASSPEDFADALPGAESVSG